MRVSIIYQYHEQAALYHFALLIPFFIFLPSILNAKLLNTTLTLLAAIAALAHTGPSLHLPAG